MKSPIVYVEGSRWRCVSRPLLRSFSGLVLLTCLVGASTGSFAQGGTTIHNPPPDNVEIKGQRYSASQAVSRIDDLIRSSEPSDIVAGLRAARKLRGRLREEEELVSAIGSLYSSGGPEIQDMSLDALYHIRSTHSVGVFRTAMQSDNLWHRYFGADAVIGLAGSTSYQGVVEAVEVLVSLLGVTADHPRWSDRTNAAIDTIARVARDCSMDLPELPKFEGEATAERVVEYVEAAASIYEAWWKEKRSELLDCVNKLRERDE